MTTPTGPSSHGTPPGGGEHRELRFYRRRTLRMLKRYMRMSIEVGRLPSLLGRELFRAKISHHQSITFEDAVILVHDVEQILCKLNAFDEQIIAMMVLQEYSQGETAELLGCARRTVVRRFPEVLDFISELLLDSGLLRPICDPDERRAAESQPDDLPEFDVHDEHSHGCGKPCQEGEEEEWELSDSEDGKNVLWKLSQSLEKSVIL